jgi:3-methyladenine DNA glycosylase AlkD
MLKLLNLRKELKTKANPQKAKILQKFFKTGPGEYGQGDIFLGVTMPEIRKLIKKYSNLELEKTIKLLKSKIHEERMLALLILINKFQNQNNRKKIYNLYLKNIKHINNWDLVDLSAYKIIGDYLLGKPRLILYKLAKSKNLWQKRISIIATFSFIKNNDFEETLKIAEILLKDKNDLIHKAVGWMLREVGKRNIKKEKKFLDKHLKKMPRTMFCYAIEKFPEKERKQYLKK